MRDGQEEEEEEEEVEVDEDGYSWSRHFVRWIVSR